MKIDYSKWSIQFIDAHWTTNVFIQNLTDNISIPFNTDKDRVLDDNPLLGLKEMAKKCIQNYYFEEELNKHKGQTIPVEDNLDIIEQEAKKQGLI